MLLPDPTAQLDLHRTGRTTELGAPLARSVAVVIPMPNDPPWDLFDHIPSHIPIIVSDDSNGSLTPPERENVFIYDYADQKEYCGQHYDAMPHKSAASRNVGHYIAYNEGFDVIIALDYDCRTKPGWFDAHLDSLVSVTNAPAVRPAALGGWVNSIEQEGWFARGYPYELRSPSLAEVVDTTATGPVKLNMGVWDNILDLNGVDKMQADPPDTPGLRGPENCVALGPLPLCGMNTAFAAELTPAYFFLPDVWVNGWQLSRHDDIWGGYVLESLMLLRGDLYTYGRPVVEHTRQTRLERVVVLEQWMHLMSMGFYRAVDEAVARIRPAPYNEMFGSFVDEFCCAVDRSPEPTHYKDTYRELAVWMRRWTEAFS
jgi:hypothetical protein